MYNPLLDTFIAVCEAGSFTKASEALFISPTAIMKQINALEAELKLKLFERSSKGVRLTPAGEIIYRDAKFIIDYSNKSILEARQATEDYDKTFCVGTSLLNPAKPFIDLWYRVNDDFQDYKLHLISFEDDHMGILSEIEKLGEKFDFQVGICDSKARLSLCNFLELGTYKKMVAVPRDHPLAKKDRLEISDLNGYKLMMVKEGDSALNDKLRAFLIESYPQILIEDTAPFYDLSVFNRCAETGNLLLTTECRSEVHPGLVTLDVNRDFSIPYGILYSLDPDPGVLSFIEAVKKII